MCSHMSADLTCMHNSRGIAINEFYVDGITTATQLSIKTFLDWFYISYKLHNMNINSQFSLFNFLWSIFFRISWPVLSSWECLLLLGSVAASCRSVPLLARCLEARSQPSPAWSASAPRIGERESRRPEGESQSNMSSGNNVGKNDHLVRIFFYFRYSFYRSEVKWKRSLYIYLNEFVIYRKLVLMQSLGGASR